METPLITRTPPHRCGVCDAEAFVHEFADGDYDWFVCVECDESHTTQDCCAADVRGGAA